MIRSLPRRPNIGMALVELEVRAPVLQHEAGVLGDEAAAKTYVNAVDEGDAVAFLVGHGEVDGVAVVVGWRAVGEGRGRLFGVEEFGSGGEIGFGDEVCGGDF